MTFSKTGYIATAVCLAAVALFLGCTNAPARQEPLHTPAVVTPQPTPEPTPTPEPPYTSADVEMLAKLIWAEARGIPSDAEKAAVVWCVLNRVDGDRWPDTIAEVVTQPYQFAYYSSNPATEELLALAEDVLSRWWREQEGETDVGRVLPANYYFFGGDGKHNYFRTEYVTSSTRWDWSLPDPYTE